MADEDRGSEQPNHTGEQQSPALAAKYNSYYEGGQPHHVPAFAKWPRDRNQALLAVHGQGDTLLEIGCAGGEVLYQMRGRYKRLIGTELAVTRLNSATELLSDCDFTPVLATGDTVPEIATETVDRVISSDVIEHTVDVYAHLADIHRILRPGGDLVVNTPNVALVTRRLQLLVGRFPCTSYGTRRTDKAALFDGGHLHYFTFGLLSELLQQTGFEIIGRMGFGRFGRLHNLWPEVLSSSVQIQARKPLKEDAAAQETY